MFFATLPPIKLPQNGTLFFEQQELAAPFSFLNPALLMLTASVSPLPLAAPISDPVPSGSSMFLSPMPLGLSAIPVTSNSYIDPDTGNERFPVTIVEVPVAIRNQRVRSVDVPTQGIDPRTMKLSGYILASAASVRSLDFSQKVRMTLRNSAGSQVSGMFSFTETPTPFDKVVRQSIGIPISGKLELIGSGEIF